jgi:hypothetical protein
MLQERGGPGNFDTFTGGGSSGRSTLFASLNIADVLRAHDAWPWTIVPADRKRTRNQKWGMGGPRINGWAPVRPYTRSIAYQSVSGMNAYAYIGFYDVWTGAPVYLGRGTADGIQSFDLSILGPGFGEYLPDFGSHIAVPQGMIDQVTTELLGKLADRKVHLGNAIAESRKTIGTIVSRTTKVLSAYKSLRKGNIALAAKHLGIDFKKGFLHRSIADTWLEMQYGWLPLLSDIYGASEELKDQDRQADQIVRVARQIGRVSQNPGFSHPSTTVEGSCQISLKAYAFYRVSDETQVWLSSLGLLNPAEVAWELTPFSFVLDWFIPVGDFLEGLTAATGMQFIDGGYAIKARGKFEATDLPIDKPPSGSSVLNPRFDLTITSEAFCFTRVKMSSPPRASLYAKSPYSDKRVFNAVALLTSLRRK